MLTSNSIRLLKTLKQQKSLIAIELEKEVETVLGVS